MAWLITLSSSLPVITVNMLCEKEMVQKRCFYEWSCRIPLIARFPDGWKAGTSYAEPVSLLDLLPTFAELAGVETLLHHDGMSLNHSTGKSTI